MTKSEIPLFLDSDGVIYDFNKRAVELLDGKQISEVPKGTLWGRIERYNTNVAPFFETLELMPDAERLVQFAVDNFENVAVLTATGYTPKDGAEQKIRKYAKQFPGLKVICVAKSPDKAEYAVGGAILVDDRMKSLDPWAAKGGIGVFHKSVDDTIRQLQELIG